MSSLVVFRIHLPPKLCPSFRKESFWDTCRRLKWFWNPTFTTAPIPVPGIFVPITFTWSKENSFTRPTKSKSMWYLACATGLIVPNNIESCQAVYMQCNQHNPLDTSSSVEQVPAWTITPIKDPPSYPFKVRILNMAAFLSVFPLRYHIQWDSRTYMSSLAVLRIHLPPELCFWDTCRRPEWFWNPAFTTAPIPVRGIFVPITFAWSKENSFTRPTKSKSMWYLACATGLIVPNNIESCQAVYMQCKPTQSSWYEQFRRTSTCLNYHTNQKTSVSHQDFWSM